MYCTSKSQIFFLMQLHFRNSSISHSISWQFGVHQHPCLVAGPDLVQKFKLDHFWGAKNCPSWNEKVTYSLGFILLMEEIWLTTVVEVGSSFPSYLQWFYTSQSAVLGFLNPQQYDSKMVSNSNPLWSIRKFRTSLESVDQKLHPKNTKKIWASWAFDEWMGCLEIWYVYIYIYLEPKWPLFLMVNPSTKRPFRTKRRSFGFQV